MRISDWSSDVCSSDLDNANRGNLLARRARNTGRVDVDRTFGKFAFGASLKGASHRFDNAANTVRLGGYAPDDRKSVVSGKSVSVRVDLGGRRIFKKKKTR